MSSQVPVREWVSGPPEGVRRAVAYERPMNWHGHGDLSLPRLAEMALHGERSTVTEAARDGILCEWQMAVDAYALGWTTERAMQRARIRFLRRAADFYHHCLYPPTHEEARRKYPNNPAQQVRYEQLMATQEKEIKWQAGRAAQMERARQRALLRQGHRTLTDIRRLLRGAVRSLPLESRLARTSPTS